MKAPKVPWNTRTDVDCWSSSMNLCTYVRGCTLKRLTRSSLTCFIQSQFFNTLIFSHLTVLRLRFTQTSDAASFFVFIFRALRPCDQDSPISACNGNQFTEHPARMTMIEQERRYNSRFIRLLERKTHLSWEKSNWKYPTIYVVDWSWRKSQSSRRTSKNSIIGLESDAREEEGGSGVKTRRKF